MKKILLIMASVAVVSATQAQQKTASQTTTKASTNQDVSQKNKKQLSPEEKAEKFLNKMHAAVNLDEKQKAIVRSLALDHFRDVEKIRKQANGDKEKMKPEVIQSRKIMQEGLKKVLSTEQLELWKKSRKNDPKKQKKHSEAETNDLIED
jgi:hypothetical protein